jgi:uncharacterized RDD family membrane protein YckC
MGMAAAAFPPDGTVGDLATGDLALVARRAAARTIDTLIGFATFLAIASAYAYAFRSEDGTGAMIVAIGLTFVLYLLHELLGVAFWGRTLGKRLLGLRVVPAEGTGRPGLWAGFRRLLIPTALLFFLLYPLPFLVAAAAPGHRWPHDRLAGTRVIPA